MLRDTTYAADRGRSACAFRIAAREFAPSVQPNASEAERFPARAAIARPLLLDTGRRPRLRCDHAAQAPAGAGLFLRIKEAVFSARHARARSRLRGRFAKMTYANDEQRMFFAVADAGFITQSVYLFCACVGLGTIVRGLIDRRNLAAALGLAHHERIALAQTVGYPRMGSSRAMRGKNATRPANSRSATDGRRRLQPAASHRRRSHPHSPSRRRGDTPPR